METTTREIESGFHVISLDGRWDAQSSPGVQETVMERIKPNNRLVLDLGSVGYMSSAALRTLVLIYREVTSCQSCSMVLASVNDRLRDVMEITGFIDQFDIYATVQDGISALQA